jgi:hypothetical protein
VSLTWAVTDGAQREWLSGQVRIGFDPASEQVVGDDRVGTRVELESLPVGGHPVA